MPEIPSYSNSQFAALKSEVLWVTPDMARTLRASCHFDRQRPINSNHVTRLASEMQQGWFLQGTPIWLCVLPDGSMLIINGNHTLEAVADSGVSLPLTFIYQKVDSEEEAAKSYICFDIQRVRTWAQTATALNLSEEIPHINKVMPALGIILQEFSYDSRRTDISGSRQLRLAAINDYKQAALFFAHSIQGAPKVPKRHVTRSAILAVALVTFKFQPAAAAEFWSGMAMDNGLASSDPRKALLRYLENTPARNSNDTEVYCKAAALAWNAFFQSRELTFIKPNQSLSFRLLGTPWHRGIEARRTAELAQAEGEVSAPILETGVAFDSNGMPENVVRANFRAA